MSTTIGKMRYPLQLQTASYTADSGGGSATTWTTTATIYGDINPVRAEEKYRQGQVQESVTHEVYVRYRAGLTTANRLVYDNRTFNVKGVINVDERKRFMKLNCQEGAN